MTSTRTKQIRKADTSASIQSKREDMEDYRLIGSSGSPIVDEFFRQEFASQRFTSAMSQRSVYGVDTVSQPPALRIQPALLPPTVAEYFREEMFNIEMKKEASKSIISSFGCVGEGRLQTKLSRSMELEDAIPKHITTVPTSKARYSYTAELACKAKSFDFHAGSGASDISAEELGHWKQFIGGDERRASEALPRVEDRERKHALKFTSEAYLAE